MNLEAETSPAHGDRSEPNREPSRAALGVSPRPFNSGLVWAFSLTTFLSAVLLFSIQPMFAKMVLPVLGGAPSVWAVAVCFFQIALLVGYCYAHALRANLPLAKAGMVHLALCVAAFMALPIALPSGWAEPPPGEPYLWQLGLFTVAVGLPFVTVAANAPLIQAWFAETGHPSSKDPYFLYAASNLGSLLALLAYPFVLEPLFGVSALSRYWTVGFVLLVVCLAGLYFLARNYAAKVPAAQRAATDAVDLTARQPNWNDRGRWILYSMVPSALLTAFTTHIATDVASAPLLWVLPLSLYLMTFVLVFREKSPIPGSILLPLHMISVVMALLVLSQTRHDNWFVTAPFGTAAFVLSAMVAHRTLYEARPAARHLTEFYLWMSFGGALGGLAAALVAPKIFSEVFEYPLLLALTFACRPGALSLDANKRDSALMIWVIAAFAFLSIYWVPWALGRLSWSSVAAWLNEWGSASIVAALMAFTVVANWTHPMRQLAAALGMCAAVTLLPSAVKRGDAQRSYFGVYRVMQSPDGQYNTLVHGSTLHGAQRIRDEDGNPVADISPATYYYDGSPMARTVATRRQALEAQGRKGRYGVIGLGTGSLACHSAKDEAWRIFEIDPLMIEIASGDKNFTFLENCMPQPDIKLGDARLTLAKEPDASYDLLIVDAFSSDAVPVHLMTAEAMKLYLTKLTPDGVVLLHISNRYLDLDAVLGATATAVPGIHGYLLSDDVADGSYAQSTSTVGLFAKSDEALEAYKTIAEMKPLDASKMRPWTDDYSDILRPFISKYKRRFMAEPEADTDKAIQDDKPVEGGK